MSKLTGKKALVTGGSRGIGAAIARRLAEAGADVAITYRQSQDLAEEIVQKVQNQGGKGLAIQADATQGESVVSAVEQVMNTYGGLDILVNSAGIFEMKPLGQTTLEDFDRMVNINVRAVFAAANAAVKYMKSGGRIINIGSTNGDFMPFPGGSLYAMSKSAVATMSRGWARDLGQQGITVNTIQPGPIDTDMNPADGPFGETLSSMMALGHYGKPQDIAEMAAFLASPQASFITGAVLDVDGGFTA